MDEIGELIDWSAVVKLLDGIYGSDEGSPSYPLLTYVKLLLLQQWYGLSDPGLEESVDDRLSFRRFAGLPLDEGERIASGRRPEVVWSRGHPETGRRTPR